MADSDGPWHGSGTIPLPGNVERGEREQEYVSRLRDELASKAMAYFLTRISDRPFIEARKIHGGNYATHTANLSYELADAMLKRRLKDNNNE